MRPHDSRFFGHPPGLGVLAGTELWERFSFYGMQAILMLYMTKRLLAADVAPTVWGLQTFRGLFGEIDDLAFAAQTFGIYSGVLYATPLIGAFLGDSRLGKTRTVIIGALMMTGGHLAMASEQAFLMALSLIALGAGLVIGNMAAQVGALYPPEDHRRTRAFAIYLMALNLGALASPLVIGTLGEKVGWHWGFGAAGIGMLLGLVTYLVGRRHLPPDVPAARRDRRGLTPPEWSSVRGLLLIFIPYILCTTAFQQAYGLMLVWADTGVDHVVLGWTVPITWVLVFDGVATIAGCWLAASIWKRGAARGREPGDIAKLAIGCALVAAAYFYAAAMVRLPLAPMIVYLGFFVILDLSICWVEAPTAALVSRNAPAPVSSMMMALFKASTAVSYFALGWLARFYEPLGASNYWAATALLPVIGVVLIVLFGARVTAMLDSRGAESETTARSAAA